MSSENDVWLNNALQAMRVEFEKSQEERVHDIEFSINNKIMSRIENLERTNELNSWEFEKSLNDNMRLEDRLNKMEETMKMNYNVLS